MVRKLIIGFFIMVSLSGLTSAKTEERATLNTDCVISGGGPAGLMLGYLLAREGVDVTILEKHKDFLRDFRGDTVHPSTLEVFKELGLLDELLNCPHQKTEAVSIEFEGKEYQVADFSSLSTHCKYIAMMPQWDFLDFIAEQGAKFPNFHLLRSTKSEDLIEDQDGKVMGIRAENSSGPLEVYAQVSVAADGRWSKLRQKSGLELIDLGAPIDVFWMRLPKSPSMREAQSGAVVNAHGFLVKINREDYWQCAMLHPKGDADLIRAQGIEKFREKIVLIDPEQQYSVSHLQSWNDVKLLDVQVNHLKKWWRPGFISIGDAAHAMSPVGGVGINLAIQDAIAAARILAKPLKSKSLSNDHLAKIQKRREWPAKLTQKAQVNIHNRFLYPLLTKKSAMKPPLFLRLLANLPFLRWLPAYGVGVGAQPEHWAPSH